MGVTVPGKLGPCSNSNVHCRRTSGSHAHHHPFARTPSSYALHVMSYNVTQCHTMYTDLLKFRLQSRDLSSFFFQSIDSHHPDPRCD